MGFAIQVDSALLGHPRVAEAVSFAAPDEKYGEVVAAAVVLTQPAGGDAEAIVADIRKFAASKLAKFKVSDILPCSCHNQCVACCLCIANLLQTVEHCHGCVTCSLCLPDRSCWMA